MLYEHSNSNLIEALISPLRIDMQIVEDWHSRIYEWREFKSGKASKDNRYIKILLNIGNNKVGLKYKQISRVLENKDVKREIRLLKRIGLLEYENERYKLSDEGKKFLNGLSYGN